MQEAKGAPSVSVRWFDNPAYGYTKRTDSIVILLVIVIFSILLALRITVEGLVFIVIMVTFIASVVRIGGLHRTPLRIGLSSDGLFIIRGILKKTSFIAWSTVRSIRVTRVFPFFAEPADQVAVMFEFSRENRSTWSSKGGVSVTKAIAEKIIATANVPVKKGRLGSR